MKVKICGYISVLLQPDKIDADITYNESEISLHLLLKGIFEDHLSQDLITAICHMKGHMKKAEEYISEKLRLSSMQVQSFKGKENGTRKSRPLLSILQRNPKDLC